MFEPIRGGTRGGQGEFKWSDVSADKDREVCIVYSFVFIPKIHIVQNYLGHSTNAPTGRWQKNKDIHWYSRDIKDTSEERAEEIRKIKEAEAEALSVALCVSPISYLFSFNYSTGPSFSGFGPSKKEGSSSTPSTGTNSIPVPARVVANVDVNPDAAVKAAEKAERKRRRAERREERAARRAEKAARKDPRDRRRRDESSSRSRSRSRSLTPPVRQRRYTRSPSPKRYRSRSRDGSSGREIRFPARDRDRSRSPPRRREFDRRSELPPPRRLSPDDRYGGSERSPERVRDRERWNHNARR